MSKCRYCNREMTDRVECTVTHYQSSSFMDTDGVQHFGAVYTRIPFGEERHLIIDTTHCPGCFVAIGQLHHVGCDVEECPKCGRQVLKCGCDLPHALSMKTSEG